MSREQSRGYRGQEGDDFEGTKNWGEGKLQFQELGWAVWKEEGGRTMVIKIIKANGDGVEEEKYRKRP